jgi:YbgC/YbaW family acyl-CoA thioester hydrolase
MQSISEIIVKPDDIDHLGHVNYMKYLFYLEVGIGEWYRQAGVSMDELTKKKLGTVLIKFDLSYLQEARLGDTLKVITTLMKVGNKSFVLKQDIYNQNDVPITECTKTFVMFDTTTRKSTPVIDEIARQFKSVG